MDVELPSDVQTHVPNTKPDFTHKEILQSTWSYPIRYSNLQLVGQGAYGRVCSAMDTQHNVEVAIKKLTKPFDSDEYAKRSYREIAILNAMNIENVLCMIDIFTPQDSLAAFKDIYIVTPRMMCDLSNVIRNNTQELDEPTIMFFIYQILRALKYMHSAGIIHRDLKPANIGVNIDLELRIMDFGLARTKNEEMTGYIATRWYRAPEVMYNWCHYDSKVDIWSVGCIMAELYNRRPLLPGTNHIDQLKRTLQIFGSPDQELLSKITSASALDYLNSLERYPGQRLTDLIPNATQPALSLMTQMLVLDPDRRLTAAAALGHSFLETYHDPNDEPTLAELDFSYENEQLSVDQWKKKIWNHIENFRPNISHSRAFPGAGDGA